MSVRLMMRVFALKLPPELKLVVIALASYANDDGSNVFPSVETLADQCSMSPRATRRWLARLRAMGIIQTIAKGGGVAKGGASGRPTLYRLDLDRAETLPLVAPFESSETLPLVAANPATGGRQTLSPVAGESSLSEIPPQRGREAGDPFDAPETPILAFLASVGATVQPNGNGFHRRLVRLVERRGVDAVLNAMRRRHADGECTDRQLIFGAENDLEPVERRPKSKAKGIAGVNVEEAVGAFRG